MSQLTDRQYRILCGSLYLHKLDWGVSLQVALSLWDSANAHQRTALLTWAARVQMHTGTRFDTPVLAVGCLGAVRWEKGAEHSVPLALQRIAAAAAADEASWAADVCSTIYNWDLRVFPYDPGQMPMLYRLAFERLSRETGCLPPPQPDAGRLASLRFVSALSHDRLAAMARQTADDIANLAEEELGPLVDALIEIDKDKLSDMRYYAGRHVLDKIAMLRPDGLQAINKATVETDPSALLETGYVRTKSGKLRRLYSEVAYELVKPAGAKPEGPMAVLADTGDYCPKCGSELAALFQFDLSDQRITEVLQGIKVDSEHGAPLLTIPMCPTCIRGWKPYFAAVSTDGTFDIMEDDNPKAPDSTDDDRPPRQCLELGAKRPTPLVAQPLCVGGAESRIGGLPAWEQYAKYPKCPECRRYMQFVGQVNGLEIDYGDSMYYAFICPKCAVSAVRLQHT